jgi:transposase
MVCAQRPDWRVVFEPAKFNHDPIMEKKVTSQVISTGPIKPAKQMPTVHPHAAGIDLGNAAHFVCVPADSVPAGQSPVRQFGVFNPQLDEMVEWLKGCQVQTVAMESTGVMWIPVFQKLEAAGLEVILVNTKGLKHVPGRKSDVLDCQWIQQLHSYGMLSGSFRPTDIICRLRTLTRQRDNLIASAGSEVQHMQKALQEMGVHLHVVISDVTGMTGLAIIDAILNGERDPKELVKLRDPRVRRSTVAEMEAALRADWREELLFVLGQSRRTYSFFQEQLNALDEKIIALLAQIPEAPGRPAQGADGGCPPNDAPPGVGGPATAPGAEPASPQSQDRRQVQKDEAGAKSRKRDKGKRHPSRGGNPLPQDIRPQLTRAFGVNLALIPGLNLVGVLILLAEIGTDLKKHWRDGDTFAAWLGLCPGSKISGGKVLCSRTPHVVNRVAILLRLAALAVGRTDTCLGVFYRRIKARHGAPKAMTATARKLAVLIYHLVTTGQEFQEPDRQRYDERVHKSKVIRLMRQAKELGFGLVPIEELDAAAA